MRYDAPFAIADSFIQDGTARGALQHLLSTNVSRSCTKVYSIRPQDAKAAANLGG